MDIYRGGPVRPDLLASVLDLSELSDDSAEAVYAGHVMEHLTLDDEVPRALAELRRVLRPGGSLMIVGPDIERADTPHLRQIIVGGEGRWPGDQHRWVSTCREMRGALQRGGWAVREWPMAEVPAAWPIVSRVEWQFALEAQ